MGSDLDRDSVAKAYARWAPVYDLVFGLVFERGRKAAAERQRRAEDIVANDPFVQSLMRDYGARIVPGSIKPV